MLTRSIFLGRRRRTGSFLVEVLLSIIILSMGVAWIIQGMAASLRAINYSAQLTVAMQALENVLSDVTFQNIIGNPIEAQPDQSLDNGNFDMQASVSTDTVTDRQHLKEVSVVVSWETSRDNNQVQTQTLFLEGLEQDGSLH